MTDVVEMFRPCGAGEWALVEALDRRAWPARLPEQPIFYPVTNERYAAEVNEWNLQDQGMGFVTRFDVEAEYLSRYEIQNVGAAHANEWWIPSEELEEFNRHIRGEIEVVGEYWRQPGPSREGLELSLPPLHVTLRHDDPVFGLSSELGCLQDAMYGSLRLPPERCRQLASALAPLCTSLHRDLSRGRLDALRRLCVAAAERGEVLRGHGD